MQPWAKWVLLAGLLAPAFGACANGPLTPQVGETVLNDAAASSSDATSDAPVAPGSDGGATGTAPTVQVPGAPEASGAATAPAVP